jgi:SAM-dependent methyltransferase
MGRFYPTSYGPHQAGRKRRGLRLSLGVFRHRSHQERPVAWHGQGRLLDFGCGAGHFLEFMRRRHWQVTGLDVSVQAVERVRRELGLRALAGTLPHPELLPASFDVVTMWHALEHLHDPLKTLQEIHRLLVPGGRLLIEVPNIASQGFQWFRHAWYGLELPRHLVHFTPQTLQQMVNRAGFRTGRVRMVARANWLRLSVKLARRHERPTFWHRWLATKWGARLTNCYCQFLGRSEVMQLTAERPA